MKVEDCRRAVTHSLLAILALLILVAAGAAVYVMMSSGGNSQKTTVAPTTSTTSSATSIGSTSTHTESSASSSSSVSTSNVASVVIQKYNATISGAYFTVLYPPGQKLPLVVFSMGYCPGGGGSCGSSDLTYYRYYLPFLKDIAAHGYAVAYLDVPSVVSTMPPDSWFVDEVMNITSVINYMNSTYPVANVDMSHIALVGHSAGGAAALEYISLFPKAIRCAVALSPPYDSSMSKGAAVPPFMMISGSADTNVPISNQEEWLTVLTSPAREVVVMSAGHDLGLDTYGSTTYSELLNHTVSFLAAHIGYIQQAAPAGLSIPTSTTTFGAIVSVMVVPSKGPLSVRESSR